MGRLRAAKGARAIAARASREKPESLLLLLLLRVVVVVVLSAAWLALLLLLLLLLLMPRGSGLLLSWLLLSWLLWWLVKGWPLLLLLLCWAEIRRLLRILLLRLLHGEVIHCIHTRTQSVEASRDESQVSKLSAVNLSRDGVYANRLRRAVQDGVSLTLPRTRA
jgi:hypothetical protein